uniref:NDP-hexose oxidoreductase n=1 Tax=Streptoalloteichus sp. ATCC 53650 TaxID=756733 RepID=K4NYV6_9PSEU|nr:NDP-hexose oxidoreductase [Streptoalloteichus sp. ATCC 53650]
MTDQHLFGSVFAARSDRPLVTVLGGSGFIGSAVVDRLARLPVRLRVVARGRPALPARPVADVRFHAADLTNADAARAAVADADAVIHLAAHMGDGQSWRAAGEEPARLNADLMRVLIAPTGDVLPVVVFASTLQAESGAAAGASDYVRHKAEAEQVLLTATSAGRVRGIAIRPTTVYGRSPLSGSTGRGVISVLAGRAVAGEPITMWHDGSVQRDFLHVRDAAAAFVAALDHVEPLCGGHWPVGTGRQERLSEVFGAIARAAAERTGRPPVPVVTVPPPDFASAHDFHSPVVDFSAFPAVTGWGPEVSLAEGLRGVVDAAVDGTG